MQDGAQLVAPCLQDFEAIASVDSLLRCRLTRIVDLYFDLELLYVIGVTSQLFGELFGAQFATLDLATLFRLAEPLIACFSPLLILRSNLAAFLENRFPAALNPSTAPVCRSTQSLTENKILSLLYTL